MPLRASSTAKFRLLGRPQAAPAHRYNQSSFGSAVDGAAECPEALIPGNGGGGWLRSILLYLFVGRHRLILA